MSKRTRSKISKPIIIIKRNGKHFTNVTQEDFNRDISDINGIKPEDYHKSTFIRGKNLEVSEDPFVIETMKILLKNKKSIPNSLFIREDD